MYVHVLLKVRSILVVFCQDLVDHRTSDGLVSCTATLLRCLADAGNASSFIPGVEMRTEVASAFHTFTFFDTGYTQPGGRSAPIRGMRSHPLHLAVKCEKFASILKMLRPSYHTTFKLSISTEKTFNTLICYIPLRIVVDAEDSAATAAATAAGSLQTLQCTCASWRKQVHLRNSST